MPNKIFPSIVSAIPNDLRQFLERVREYVGGTGRESLVKAGDLEALGLTRIDQAGQLLPATPVSTCVRPPTPMDVAAYGAMTTIFLEWRAPVHPCHSHAEVWRANVADLGQAVLVGQSPGFVYVDAVGGDAQHYYWVRFVNSEDVAGNYHAVEGLFAQTSPDPNYLIDQLTGDGPYQPLILVDEPFMLNGVLVPAGTYIRDAWIANGSISNAKIGVAAIDTAKIADASIATAKIQDAAITTAKIGLAQIGTAQIQNAAITSALIANASITTAKIGLGQITSAVIGDATIKTANIANGAISNAKIADAAISEAKIGTAAITNAKIANGAITTAKIGTAQIDTANIKNLSVNGTKITGRAVANTHIKIGGIYTENVGNNQISVSSGASNSGSTNFVGWTTVIQASISSTGAPIMVVASCAVSRWSGDASGTGGDYVDVRLLENGGTVVSGRIGSGGWSGVVRRQPGAGRRTYALQVSTPYSGFRASGRGIMVLEVKR